MKSPAIILVGCLLIALIVSGVSAISQTANGMQVGGSDNTQVVINYDNHQTGTGTQIGGNGNTIANTNVNVNGNINNGATSVNNQQDVTVIIPSHPAQYALAIDNDEDAIITLYAGQAVAIPVTDKYGGEKLNTGETVNMSWMSGMPVYVSVVKTSDSDAAIHTYESAPVYDSVYQKFDPTGVYHYKVNYMRDTNSGLSRQNVVQFTVPEDGKYSFIVDTRPAISRNGATVIVSDDTIDFSYRIGYVGYYPPQESKRVVIGTHEELKINKIVV